VASVCRTPASVPGVSRPRPASTSPPTSPSTRTASADTGMTGKQQTAAWMNKCLLDPVACPHWDRVRTMLGVSQSAILSPVNGEPLSDVSSLCQRALRAPV